ncbi:MAG: hypothetical protein ACHQXA_08685 [Gemmatimonadales bacterium]
MNRSRMAGWMVVAVVLLIGACHDATPAGPSGLDGLVIESGDRQGLDSGAVAAPLVVRLWSNGHTVSGAMVSWVVTRGGGGVSAPSSVTDSTGRASVTWMPGVVGFGQGVRATVAGLTPVEFSITRHRPMTVVGGGNNVSSRYSSDLWLAGGYAYTGSWGFRATLGNVVSIWPLDGAGAPGSPGTLTLPGVGTISDLQVSPDSTVLAVTGEYGSGSAGLYLYSLADRANPALLGSHLVSQGTSGLHTGTLAVMNGVLYDFTARDPSSPSLLTFRIQPDSTVPIVLVDSILMPANYGIHDTFVRDGLLFVENWNEGVWIYDIGGGGMGGRPDSAVFISSIVTQGGEVHNAWWFHNPVTGEKKYLFVGQEGPGIVGATSSGDIHVVDISNLAAPVEVAQYHLDGAGTHNFWMDEPRQILYAAYYNGGVVALDVSGTLAGDLASRVIARLQPGGANDTYVWGVMLYGGHLYAVDMLSGLWELSVP